MSQKSIQNMKEAKNQDERINKRPFEREKSKDDSDSIYSFDVDLEEDPSEEESVIYQSTHHPIKSIVDQDYEVKKPNPHAPPKLKLRREDIIK